MNPVSVTVKGFRGLDQRAVYSDDPSVSPDMNNFRVCGDGSLKKRPGRRLSDCAFNGQIYYMWRGWIDGELLFLICAGKCIYRLNAQTHEISPVTTIPGECRHMFPFGGSVYFICSSGYYKYTAGVFAEVEPYIPLIAVSTLPDGSGTLYEKANMLTGKKRQQFSSDGSSAVYHLAEQLIDTVISVMVGGTKCPAAYYTFDAGPGTVTFSEDHIPPEGLNNVEITWEKSSTASADIILGCRRSMNFGGNTDTRVFLYGNDEHPNYRYHSELADGLPSAEYFPETNYTVIGVSKINDIVQQYDRQLIFTEDRAFYSFCELRTDILGSYYSSFPVYNLNFEKGNLISNGSAVIDNTPVTLSDDGLNRWISTAVQDERNAECFSMPICDSVKEIIEGFRYGECSLYDRQSEGELWFSTPLGVFIYCYRTGIWYRYDAINAVVFCEIPGRLYWLNSEGELWYTSESLTTDDGNAYTAYWRTPLCTFGSSGGLLNLNSVTVVTDRADGTELTVSAEPTGNGQTMNLQTLTLGPTEDGGTLIDRTVFRTEIKRAAAAQITLSSSDTGNGCHVKAVTFTYKTKEAGR